MVNRPDPPSPDRETEQKILDAAESVFVRRGTAGARMAEIAEEAGVNQALLHYYFRSKERLSAAVFEQIAGRVFPALTQTLGAEPGGVLPPLCQQLGRQINERVAAGTMRPIAPEQFAINLISLCIFPFAARPMLRLVFGMDEAAFARFIEQRKTELPAFFRNALRP